LADVAALAGVSKTAVSKALLGNKGKTTKVSEATALKIRTAASSLNYIPNQTAINLATRRTGFIGYVLSDTIGFGWQNMYFSRYFTGVEEACRNTGYGVYTAKLNLAGIEKVVFPERLKKRSVDGIIAVGSIPAEVRNIFTNLKIPAIFLNRDLEYEKAFPTFCADPLDGIRKAVFHAAELGHRHIMLCQNANLPTHRRTDMEELLNELKNKRLTARCDIIKVQFPELPIEDTGKVLFSKWMGIPSEKRPTFIIGGESPVINIMINELMTNGIKIPGDISVVAGPENYMSQFAVPPLTTIEYDFEKIGFDAVNTLVSHIENRKPLDISVSNNDYKAKIIIRNSTRCLK
jgi:LacI family transcriptional regulator